MQLAMTIDAVRLLLFPALMAFAASLLGGALTLLIVQFRLFPLPRLLQGAAWAERLHRKDAGVPYGIALAAAALIVYPQTVWMQPLAS